MLNEYEQARQHTEEFPPAIPIELLRDCTNNYQKFFEKYSDRGTCGICGRFSVDIEEVTEEDAIYEAYHSILDTCSMPSYTDPNSSSYSSEAETIILEDTILDSDADSLSSLSTDEDYEVPLLSFTKRKCNPVHAYFEESEEDMPNTTESQPLRTAGNNRSSNSMLNTTAEAPDLHQLVNFQSNSKNKNNSDIPIITDHISPHISFDTRIPINNNNKLKTLELEIQTEALSTQPYSTVDKPENSALIYHQYYISFNLNSKRTEHLRQPPKFSCDNIINPIIYQLYPWQLTGLNWVEEQVVAKVHYMGILIKITNKRENKSAISHNGTHGH